MVIETGVEKRRWYVVLTKGKQEERASKNLLGLGVETLSARLKTRRYNEFTGVPVYITEPLFPRKIFARFNAREQLSKILFTRGVHSVFCFGNQPACVSEAIIELIRARIDQNGFVKDCNDLRPEDMTVINPGPLRNLIEIFEREVKGSERSLILLAAIGSQDLSPD
jgi:transcription antitermination factor NusG